MIRKLVAKFLKEVGRSDMPGRPILIKQLMNFGLFWITFRKSSKIRIPNDDEELEKGFVLSRYKEE